MQKLIETLKKLGIEVPEDKQSEVKRAVSEHYKNVAEYNKAISKLETERDGWKERAESAEDTIKGLEGKDFDAITKERDAWKDKFDALEAEQNKAKQEAELEAAINAHVESLKFKDEYRKRAYIEDLKKEGYQVKDGKLIGASDFQKKYDADAFVDEQQSKAEQNKARFTSTMSNSGGGTTVTKSDILAMKDPSERQKAIKEHIELFQKGEQ